MGVPPFFLQADVALPLAAAEKWSAIRELCERAASGGVIPASALQEVHEEIATRERSLSTGMGHGLAVPHAFTQHVAEPSAILGISPKGCSFESLDGQPAHLVVLLLAPASAQARQQHLQTLAQLAGLCMQGDFIDSLCKCSDLEAVRDYLSDL